jgi:hypothetical protein
MITYTFIIFFLYIGILIYILPTWGQTFDLYKRKFRLLPSWFKIVALIWLIISVIIVLILKETITKWKELLLSSINISLFMFYFSKLRNEDEYSQIIRFKSFTYSFMGFIALFGAFGALNVNDVEVSFDNFMLQGYLGGGLLITIVYFYFTLYSAKK